MDILKVNGYELVKEKSNTSEDYFNRSEVTFIENGEERTLSVLYVRYFEEKVSEVTSYNSDSIFQINNLDVSFKEIFALICLLKNSRFQQRKRVYINNQLEFNQLLQETDFEQVRLILETIQTEGRYQHKEPHVHVRPF